MVKTTDGMEAITPAHKRRLKACAFSSWAPESNEMTENAHQAALAVLYEAGGKKGLPMPGGFLLDPERLAQRITLPAGRWGVLLGYHPRFGVLLGNKRGGAKHYPVYRPASIYSADSHALGHGNPICRDWNGLLDRLFTFEDACACAYAVWIRVGDRHDTLQPIHDHWRVLGQVINGKHLSHIQSIAAVLGASPLFDYARVAFQGRGEEVFLIAQGTDLFVACEQIEDIDSVLEYASTHGLPAQPECLGTERVHEDACRRESPAVYRMESEFPPPGSGITAVQDGDDYLWACFNGTSSYRRKRVSPGRVPRAFPALIDGASPRLERFLGRHGVSEVAGLRSEEGVAKWVDETEHAKGWSVLVDIEREVGGLIMTPEWGLNAPDRLGPWLILQEAESLRGLNSMVDPEDASRFEARPWPFLRLDGVELAVIGVSHPRIDCAWAADADGSIYYIDHEFLTLTLKAEKLLTLLERRALRLDLYGNGLGIANKAALSIAATLTHSAIEGLGFSRVDAASDSVADTYLFADESAKLDLHKKRGRTTLFAHDASIACQVALAMREHFPDESIQVHLNTGDTVDADRKRALTNADIPGLVFRSWFNFRM